jgi:hypothetical protein
MDWYLKGTYFESCPCDVVCPCTASSLTMPADTERCRVVYVYHIDAGEVDGVSVNDRSVGLIADTPQLMSEGDWRFGLFIDSSASPQQSRLLRAIFSGELGGPMARTALLVGEWLGVEVAPIEYEDEGRSHRVKIGDFIAIEIEDLVPSRSETGEPVKLSGLTHPASSVLNVARTVRSRVKAFGLEFSTEGKNGFSAAFHWVG